MRYSPRSYSVAERMSWASHRETTRQEDIAYCLFGIFAVNLPLLYGEGDRAFMRLQEEIVRQTNDLSIFAWKAEDPRSPCQNGLRSIFANSPAEFASSQNILSSPVTNPEFTVTNKGLRIEAQLTKDADSYNNRLLFMTLSCRHSGMPPSVHMGIWLRETFGYYFRVKADELPVPDDFDEAGETENRFMYIVKNDESSALG